MPDNGGFGHNGMKPGDHPVASFRDNPQNINRAGRPKGYVNKDTEYRETFEAFRTAYRERHQGNEPYTGFWFMLEQLNNPDVGIQHKRMIAAHLLKYESRLPAQRIEFDSQESIESLAGRLKQRNRERQQQITQQEIDQVADTFHVISQRTVDMPGSQD